jgi:glycosyltransferase involved in cell wall biosynthesis
MSKRVLLVARVLDSSGVTTHILTLAQGLMSMGWEVAVASGGQVGDHSYGPQRFEENGIPHFYIPFPNRSLTAKNFINGLRTYWKINSLIKSFLPQIIHVHWPSTSPYIRAIQLLHKIPFLSTIHLQGMPTGLTYRLGAFWGDKAIAISAETRKYLIENYKVLPSKICVVYNGVDESYFIPPSEEDYWKARQSFGLNQQDKVVSLLARLEYTKGHDVLIKAISLLRAKGLDVIALFAGEGTCAKAFAQQSVEYGVADLVRQVGHVDSRQVLWASDVSVLPSRVEGFPIVVVESMLCRVVPIRTPAAGAYDQIQDGVNGFIVPFDDPETLALRLEQLFTERQLKNKMAENALISAKNKFTRQLMLEKTVSVYQEILQPVT